MKKIISVLTICLMMCSTLCAAPGTDDFDKDVPATTQYIDEGGVSILGSLTAIDRVLANFRQGCRVVYASAATITIELGEVVVSNAAGTTRVLTQNTSDTTATWANIDTGSETVSTTYYVYATSTSDSTNTFTVMISASSTTPTGATYWKKLGSFVNDADGNIVQITNDGFFTNAQNYESKTYDVIYQATTDLYVSAYDTAHSTLYLYSDGTSSPSTLVDRHADADGDNNVSGIILAGNYYQVDGASTTTIQVTALN